MVNGGTLNLTGGTISGNHATTNGGGIFISAANHTEATTILNAINAAWPDPAVAANLPNLPQFSSNSSNSPMSNIVLRDAHTRIRPRGGLTSIAALNHTTAPFANANLFNNFDIFVQNANGWGTDDEQRNAMSGAFPDLDFGVRPLNGFLQVHRLGDGNALNNFYNSTPIGNANITVTNPHNLTNWQLQVSFQNNPLGNMMRVGTGGVVGTAGIVYTNSTNSPANPHTINWAEMRDTHNRDVQVVVTPGTMPATLDTQLTWTFVPQ